MADTANHETLKTHGFGDTNPPGSHFSFTFLSLLMYSFLYPPANANAQDSNRIPLLTLHTILKYIQVTKYTVSSAISYQINQHKMTTFYRSKKKRL